MQIYLTFLNKTIVNTEMKIGRDKIMQIEYNFRDNCIQFFKVLLDCQGILEIN